MCAILHVVEWLRVLYFNAQHSQKSSNFFFFSPHPLQLQGCPCHHNCNVHVWYAYGDGDTQEERLVRDTILPVVCASHQLFDVVPVRYNIYIYNIILPFSSRTQRCTDPLLPMPFEWTRQRKPCLCMRMYPRTLHLGLIRGWVRVCVYIFADMDK